MKKFENLRTVNTKDTESIKTILTNRGFNFYTDPDDDGYDNLFIAKCTTENNRIGYFIVTDDYETCLIYEKKDEDYTISDNDFIGAAMRCDGSVLQHFNIIDKSIAFALGLE
jgi:hypothetical protein